jgi:hypothetical protein
MKALSDKCERTRCLRHPKGNFRFIQGRYDRKCLAKVVVWIFSIDKKNIFVGIPLSYLTIKGAMFVMAWAFGCQWFCLGRPWWKTMIKATSRCFDWWAWLWLHNAATRNLTDWGLTRECQIRCQMSSEAIWEKVRQTSTSLNLGNCMNRAINTVCVYK